MTLSPGNQSRGLVSLCPEVVSDSTGVSPVATRPAWPLPARTILTVGLVSIAIDAVLRVVLVIAFGSRIEVSLLDLPSTLVRGLLNDLVALPLLLLPLTTILFASPRVVWTSRAGRAAVTTFVWIALFGRLYLAAVEYFFFEEFTSRMNLVAVDYLVSPTEVMVNIWDSYPVARVLAVTAVLTSCIVLLLRTPIRADAGTRTPRSKRLGALVLHATVAIALPVLIPVSVLATHERRFDQVSFNGVTSFIEALRTNDISYSDHYRMIPEARAFELARKELLSSGDQWANGAGTDLRRTHAPSRSDLTGRNVVVILEESLGCEHTGACGGVQNLTPNVDRLATQGILWSNAWATGTRTVRGIEAVVTSLPPIPSRSVVKRPGSEGIATWGRVMSDAGYHTSFLYGGYGTFDNMNHFFESNGFAVSDRREIDSPVFSNIWGVSDEDLFDHALAYFDARAAERRPFFSIVLTTSNHKPFTFREGVPGVPSEGGGRSAGVRYADLALGEFIREAKSHSWYDQTIFVVLGDHGSRVYGRGEIPLVTYRIPILIFGADIQPQVISAPTSQIDVAPTVMGLLGIPYTAPFYGRDVIAHADSERPIFVSHNNDVGMLVGDRLVVLGLGRTASVYRYDPTTDVQTAGVFDEALVDRATAVYESSFLLFSRGEYR